MDVVEENWDVIYKKIGCHTKESLVDYHKAVGCQEEYSGMPVTSQYTITFTTLMFISRGVNLATIYDIRQMATYDKMAIEMTS